jgi:prolyl-tRNA synthetase
MELGIQNSKNGDFAKWYTELIQKSELIEYTDIGGCYVLRPRAYEIWEHITHYLDGKFKTKGVKNAYFPLFISQKALTKESTHLKDFCPEVAWVTHAGNMDENGNFDPESKLEEPLAIRPTSETCMYPHFAKWIRTHRNLPMQLNQWNNVVRWEFKQTTPFIRSREFLWQEGHSCFATEAEAIKSTNSMIDIYETAYADLLSIPTIKGTKTEKERFAGASVTRTLEAFISSNGKAIQAATSHNLGMNFSKMFDITYESGNKSDTDSGTGTTVDREIASVHKGSVFRYVHQTSWGFTTRSIGIMIMTHSDDKGLVLPPRIAGTQVVIVPIYKKGVEQTLDEYGFWMVARLESIGIRAEYDSRKEYRPGFKYNQHELNGVPVRIDIGIRDVQNKTYDITRRDTNVKAKEQKLQMSFADDVNQLLNEIQYNLLALAQTKLENSIHNCDTFDELDVCISVTNNGNGDMAMVPFCGDPTCEETLKNKALDDFNLHIKSLCIPDFAVESALACMCCQKSYTGKRVLFGKSY